jgi:hypothetical protein
VVLASAEAVDRGKMKRRRLRHRHDGVCDLGGPGPPARDDIS